MGRLSRHRKIKACDPFFKGHKQTDLSYNVPVNPSELDSQPFPRRAKDLFECCRRVEKKVKNVPEHDANKSKVKLSLMRREGETKKEYYDRLEQQTAQKVAEIMLKDRRVSQKRKEFLKARKEKSRKNRRKVHEDKHMDFTTDNVKFGEVVHEPPNLRTKPRHAVNKGYTESKLKVDSLFLQRTMHKKGPEKDTEDRRLLKSKKRKHMSAIEQQVSDKRRLEAIVAYRKLKKKPVDIKQCPK